MHPPGTVYPRQTVGLFDPSLEQGDPWDVNLGDQLIVRSVRHVLEDLCGFEIAARVSSLRRLRRDDRERLGECDFVIVAGTNLLSSNMNEYRQWMVSLRDTLSIRNVILLGVGWWQYQPAPNFYTRLLLKQILSKRRLHSVRDNYARRQLNAAGIHNVLNTSCPTLWGLTPELQRGIPSAKAIEVLTTVTCYNKNPEQDGKLLALLHECYSRVHFWPQGDGDAEYAQSLSSKISLLPADITKAADFLERHPDLDYVGTRLHGGIFAIQNGKRSLILAIDNRAAEIGKDVNLKVIDRSDLAAIKNWVYSDHVTDIRVPVDDIRRWINQFH